MGKKHTKALTWGQGLVWFFVCGCLVRWFGFVFLVFLVGFFWLKQFCFLWEQTWLSLENYLWITYEPAKKPIYHLYLTTWHGVWHLSSENKHQGQNHLQGSSSQSCLGLLFAAKRLYSVETKHRLGRNRPCYQQQQKKEFCCCWGRGFFKCVSHVDLSMGFYRKTVQSFKLNAR